MSNIVAMLTTLAISETNGPEISGIARVDPNSDEIAWKVLVDWNANAAQVNAACINAAIAAATAAGFTIGGADKKVILGGAS